MSVISNNTLAGASGQGGGGYEIERSLRFNNGDSTGLTWTPSSTGNTKIFTFSCWFKRSELAQTYTSILSSTAATINGLYVTLSSDYMIVGEYGTSSWNWILQSAAVFRDPAAWYHIVISIDTTQATASDRVKYWINGTLITEFYPSLNTYPSQNYDCLINDSGRLIGIGQLGNYTSSYHYDGYLADINFIDGQALAASDFGAYDTNNVWQPIEYAGTYGTNGFKLDFSDSSSTAALGTDSSGNGNTWTVNNLSTTQSSLPAASGYVALPGDAWDGDPNTYAYTGLATTWTFATPIAVTSGRLDICARVGWTWTANTNLGTVSLTQDTASWPVTGANTYPGWHHYINAGLTTINSISVSANANWTLQGVQVAGDPTTVGNQFLVFTESEIDVFRDSPTNGDPTNDTGAGGELSGNYCTFNPLGELTGGYTRTLTKGNLTAGGSGDSIGTITFGSGKTYFELTVNAAVYFSQGYYGIIDTKKAGNRAWSDPNIAAFRDIGALYGTSSTGSAPAAAAVGTIYGIAVDVDNQKMFISVNGTWLNSGNPASGTGASFTGRDFSDYAPLVSLNSGDAQTITLNTGQRAFAYTAPSGYKCLCTANLPEPTIEDGSTAFDTTLWTGNGSTQTITGLNFNPDLVWIKQRSSTYDHNLVDAVQGTTKTLIPNKTDAAATDTNVSSFNSDGFGVSSNWTVNKTSNTYVGWSWDGGSSVETLSAGDKNSQFVNQDQLWSSYGTLTNDNNTYTWAQVFSRAAHFSAGGSMYNNGPSPATWVLTSGLSCSNTVSFYVFGTNVSMTINYGLSDETTFVSSGNNRNYTFTMPFTGTIQNIRMNTAATYLGRIAVDGKMLIDNNLTFNVPSSATSITKNDSAGFSITKFNSGTAPYDATGGGYDYVYHGLNKPPEFIITKSLDSAQNWAVWHEKISSAPSSYLKLNLSDASTGSDYWSPQIEIYEMGQSQSAVSGDYISYNWTSVEGYSAFGSYTGNGAADGPFVYTGMRPAFILTKGINDAEDWYIRDTARSPSNEVNESLRPNDTGSEYSGRKIDILSNGFKIRDSDGQINQSGKIYMYAAFAENPFKTSRAR